MFMLFVATVFVLIGVYVILKQKFSQLPPGPTGLPVVGYLHKLGGKSLHLIMYELSMQYGDIFSIQLGSRLAIVLSHHDVIYETYVKKAKQFAGRPDLASFVSTNHGSIGISLCTYNDTYVSNRKNTMRAVHRLYAKAASFDSLLLDEAAKMKELFDQNPSRPINPTTEFKKIVPSAFLAMMFGKNYAYDNDEFLNIVDCYNKWFENAEADNPPDFFPILEKFPNKRLSLIGECGAAFEEFTTRKLYEADNEEENIGLVYSLFKNFGKFSSLGDKEKRHLARVVADLCGGGFDTVASSLAWCPLYLLDQPHVLRKCQEEIDSAFGDRSLSFSRRNEVPYFTATVYDALRHSSVGPLGLPRVTMDTVKFRSYTIPKNTMFFVNLWACNHDKSQWKETDILYPENFLTDDGELDQTAVKKLLTFSTGVRRCPGEKLAVQKIFILLGTLLQNYDMEMCDPPEDMLPMRGVTLKPKPHTVYLRRRSAENRNMLENNNMLINKC